MKIKEIANQYNIDKSDFETFLRKSKLEFKDGLSSISVDDSKVQEYVKLYYTEKNRIQAEINAAEQAEIDKQRAISQILISSGFNFDGYRIVKYSGYISGDDATQIPRGNWFSTSKHGEDLTNALVKIRRQALKELKEAAYDLGCNAVIGVDFDYITLEPERASVMNHGVTVYEPFVICVTANGNAVVIEKDYDNEVPLMDKNEDINYVAENKKRVEEALSDSGERIQSSEIYDSSFVIGSFSEAESKRIVDEICDKVFDKKPKGYNTKEVDALLDRICEETESRSFNPNMDKDGLLTREQIHNYEFNIVESGYDAKQVKGFLEEISQKYFIDQIHTDS